MAKGGDIGASVSLSTGPLFWDRVKKSREEGRKRVRACRKTFEAAIPPSCLVIADHLSARSLSVTRIHWNVINFDLFTSDYLNQIACYVPTNDDVSTVSVLANGSLERRSQMFVYRLSPFPFSLLAFFHPFPKQRAGSQATTFVSFGLPPSFLEASPLAPNACSQSVTQKKNKRLIAVYIRKEHHSI